MSVISNLKNELTKASSVNLQNYIEEEIFIFGFGSFAKECSKAFKKRGLKVMGHIVSMKKEVDSTEVFSIDDISLIGKTVFIGVFNREHPYQDIIDLVKSKGCKNILMPWDVYKHISEIIGFQYWLTNPEFFHENFDNIEEAYEDLADEESRKILSNLIRFRSGLMDSYSLYKSEEPQYFNSLSLNVKKNENFIYVDGGAYDGDSYIECKNLKNIDEAILFEPDPDNYEILIKNSSKFDKNVSMVPLGLSDGYSTFSFFSNDEGGHISDSGDTTICTCSLDNFLGGKKIDFLKLDIEGNEARAIEGAKKTIQNNLPVLSMSAYHKPEDLWDLIKRVKAISDGYNFYLRQHYYNSFDVVLYAIPSN